MMLPNTSTVANCPGSSSVVALISLTIAGPLNGTPMGSASRA